MLRLFGQLSLLTLLLAVIGLAGCGDNATETDAETTITVGMIGGVVANHIKDVVEPRLAAQGIRVKYVYGTAQELLPRLIAARGQTPPLDVLEVDDQTFLELRRGNLIETYDPAGIPNAAQLYPNLRDAYRIGYWVTQPAILYNIDRLRDAGLPPPKTFTDLANPAYAGRIMLTDLRHYNGYNTLVALAYENGGDETRPDVAFDILRKIRPHSYFTSALAAQQLWRNQDVWIGVSTANTGVRLKEAGINVAVVQPPVAGHPVILARGSLAIAAGTPRKRAAEAFINAVVEKDLQKAIYDVSSIIPANAAALREIIAAGDAPFKVKRTELQKLDEKDIAEGFVPRFELIDVRTWTRRFQDVIDSQPK